MPCLNACLSTTNSAKYWRKNSEQVPSLNELTSPKSEEAKKNHLCLLRASRSPICYASVAETRFLAVRDSQTPLYSRPKENCGLVQLCLLPILQGDSVFDNPDYGFCASESKRIKKKRIQEDRQRQDFSGSPVVKIACASTAEGTGLIP